jgi:uncharacterized phiE125 gp8 family phage protein
VYGLSVGQPSGVVLALEELKRHLRVDHDAEDDDIEFLALAAAELTERESRRYWLTRTLTLTLAGWPCGAIELPTVATSLSGVNYYAADGTLTALAGCQAWLTHSPPLVYPPVNASWPGLQAGKVSPVVVTYTAGYGGAADVPDAAKQAIKLAVAHWYENRGDAKDPHAEGLPPAAMRLCQLLRTGDYP